MLIKVCGITRLEDLQASVRLGVDFVGFIFHPESPRFISAEEASRLDIPGPKRVGVFVNQTIEEIASTIQLGHLDLVQLHGDYNPSLCREIGESTVIKTFWPENYSNARELLQDLNLFSKCCRYHLLDAGAKGGGHNREISSSFLGKIRPPRPWFLAGGLKPENISENILAYLPDGIDLNSGLEYSPGQKDNNLLQQAILRARNTTRRSYA